jgi:hypothetical protein
MTSEEKVRLAYRGGADLTLRVDGKRGKVLKGGEFSVPAALAPVLLRDPAVHNVEAEAASAAEEAGYPGMTVK